MFLKEANQYEIKAKLTSIVRTRLSTRQIIAIWWRLP
jgi:hypothetical protein